MRRAWVMLPEKVQVSDMIVVLNSLVSQLHRMPKHAYVKRMRIGVVERGTEGHDQVRGIEIYVEDTEEGEA